MAASTSRQPPLSSAVVPPVQSTKQKKSRKGKDKAHPTDESESNAQVNSWDGSHHDSPAWNWISLTDSSPSTHPPIFTKDGSYFLSVLGGSVKIHSVATGHVVSTLSTSSSSGDRPQVITSAILNPQNAFQLITGSLSGCIMVWDILDGVVLQTIDISQPIHHMCAHENFRDQVFVAVSRSGTSKSAKDDNGVVLRISLTPTTATAKSNIQKSSEITAVGKTKAAAGLALSQNGEWLVAIAGHKAYVAATSSLKSGFTKYVSPEALTCLAFHPSGEYFATGDDKGNIRLWYCLNEQVTNHAVRVEKKAQTTTLHWHAHAVSSIAFTPNGAYLLSGGEEAVLVIWQLHTGRKEFIPRVGAPIQAIGVCRAGNEEEYLLALADSSYSFVNASQLKVTRSYSRIKIEPPAMRYASSLVIAPLAIHSRNATIILPSSHPSSLQEYSPSSGKLISEFEVSPSNRVSRKEEKLLEHTRVERVVVSPSGEWMATVDSRDGDGTIKVEICMKIWHWKSGNWILNTRVDRPHGCKKITALAFSPTRQGSNSACLVTTALDGNAKTWRVRSIRRKSGEQEDFWVAQSIFAFRSESPMHASWSPDGSLLAVAFGAFVNLYDPHSSDLRQSLAAPFCKAVIKAYFIGQTGHYIAATGYKEVVLWDVVSGSVRWRRHCAAVIDDVVPHPIDDTFALLCPMHSPSDGKHSQVLVFGISSSTALRTRIVPFQFLNILWYSLAPSSTRTSPFWLIGITKSWSVVLVGDEISSSEDSVSSSTGLVLGQPERKRTLFQDIFGTSALVDVSKQSSSRSPPLEAHTQPWTGKEGANFFDLPAYLTPPFETLYQPLMEGFLRPRTYNDVDSMDVVAEQSQDDEDIAMESEEGGHAAVPMSFPSRVVGDEEMQFMINVFKQHSLTPKPPIPASRLMVKSNALSKIRPNGTSHAISSSPAKKVNGVPTPNPAAGEKLARDSGSRSPTPPLEDGTPLSSPNKRKRRKKSM